MRVPVGAFGYGERYSVYVDQLPLQIGARTYVTNDDRGQNRQQFFLFHVRLSTGTK